MFWLKMCTRCGGDLYEGGDVFGGYISCVQCGYYLTEAEVVALRYRAAFQQETYSREPGSERTPVTMALL